VPRPDVAGGAIVFSDRYRACRNKLRRRKVFSERADGGSQRGV